MAGRRTEYTKAKAETICGLIAEGHSLIAICKRKSMPNQSTVFVWLRQNPEFAEEYARAREAQADADADKINAIADRVLEGDLEPNAARTAIDALKWTAGKRKPKKYGDRLEHGGKVGLVVEGAEVRFIGDDD